MSTKCFFTNNDYALYLMRCWVAAATAVVVLTHSH